MSTPTIADLHNTARYQLLTELGHQNLTPFMLDYYLRRQSWVTLAHYAFTLIPLIGWFRVSLSAQGQWPALALAVLTFLVLIPIHEVIHGWAYRTVGATDVRYGFSARQMVAYAVAHNFVAGWRAFTWVAGAPFVLINGLLLGLLVLLPATYHYYLWGVLMLHTTATLGDCALLNYFWQHRRQPVYTYDDADARLSYFYARRRG